jgi:hypothetical protein
MQTEEHTLIRDPTVRNMAIPANTIEILISGRASSTLDISRQ